MKLLLLSCLLSLLGWLPAFAQVQGVYWDKEGNVTEAGFLKQDQLSDCNQQFFLKTGNKLTKVSPAQAGGYALEGDTFVSRAFEGQPLFLKNVYSGPLSLYSADEIVLHTVLIERTGSSPLNPLATNVQRTYNKDESYDTPVAILMWEDGEYALINPNKKAEGLAELKRFLNGYPEALPAIPATQKTITFPYLKDVASRYCAWYAKKKEAEDSKAGF